MFKILLKYFLMVVVGLIFNYADYLFIEDSTSFIYGILGALVVIQAYGKS